MDKIGALKEALKQGPTVDGLRNWHNFDHGVYQRGLVIPEGVVVIGAKHFTCNVFALVRGTMAFYDEDNDEVVVVEAPWCQVCETGKHRVGLALTECVAINLLNTIATTPEEAEELLVDCSDGFALTEDRKERNELHYRNSPGRDLLGSGCGGHGGQCLDGGCPSQGCHRHDQGATGTEQG